MASSLHFWFALISTWLVFTSSKGLCPRIFFQNINEKTMPYKMIEGVYTRTKDNYNNFPVYLRENFDNLGLYYYQDKNGDKLLTFGNHLGDGIFDHYGLAARLNRDPTSWLLSAALDRNDVFGRLVKEWIYYNLRNKTNYVVPVNASSPMIKAVCVDEDFRECNSDKVYLNQRLNDTSGTIWNDPTTDYFYRLEGLFRDLRPVYEHSNVPSLYLQYVDGYWIVTSSYELTNSENAMIRVKDFALRPEYITKTWSKWSLGWRDMRNLRVLCRGVTSMANICPSKPCGSKGTCVYTSSNETLCLCGSGYTGVKCSVNKQCPARHQKPDAELNFETLGNRPGNLGMTFCSEPYPSLRYYLCVDGIYTSQWRGQGSSVCTRREASTTVPATPQLGFLFLQTTGTPKAMPNFKDYLYVVPLAIVLQIFLPVAFVICAFCKMRCQEIRAYRARLEPRHRQVGHELDRLPGVTPTGGQGGPSQSDQQSQQAGQEYLGLHRSRDVNVSRIISMDMYFSFYLWLFFLIGCDTTYCTMYGEVFNMLRIIAIVMVCVSQAIVLLESCFCHELGYLKNILADESASEYIERMREVPPKIDIDVECCHFETDTRIVHYRDASGNRHTRTEPLYLNRKVVTFVDHEEFSFGSWVDVSKSGEISSLTDATLVRFEIDSSIQFGDAETANAYTWQAAEMVRRNLHRDVFPEQHTTKEIPGLKRRVSAFKDLTLKPFWMRPLFFWIATLLQMTWPYRWLFRAKTAKKQLVLEKMVYKSTTPPRDVDHHATGERSSVVNSSGTGNTCTGYQMSMMNNILGTANSPHNQNAAALSSLCLPFPAEMNPNAVLSSFLATMNNPSPSSSAPYSPFSTYAGQGFSPCAAASVPNVPPPSYEASANLDPVPNKEQ